MKVIWLVNTLMPDVIAHLNLDNNSHYSGGWIIGLFNQIKKHDIDLIICTTTSIINSELTLIENNITYIVFPNCELKTLGNTENSFKSLLDKFQPDIIHIFGSERMHAHTMINVVDIDKTLVSIQGLVSVSANHYMADLPCRYYRTSIIKNLIKKWRPVSAVTHAKHDMQLRGNREIELFKKALNVTGRTTWDKACIKQINKEIKYFFCNEILRKSFYENKWDISKCKKHSIFFSQAQYPIKGFHQLLKAMPLILEEFPDTHIFVAGGNIINEKKGIRQKIGNYINEYPSYLKCLIKKNYLYENITFLGNLNEEQMCQQYLDSNVFVMASSIENSPNSLGEAMLLGVPCIASCVGGVQDMMEHNIEGLIYPFDEPYMLAHYLCEIFRDDNLAKYFSKNSRNHALITHNRETNSQTMVDIYNNIRNSL